MCSIFFPIPRLYSEFLKIFFHFFHSFIHFLTGLGFRSFFTFLRCSVKFRSESSLMSAIRSVRFFIYFLFVCLYKFFFFYLGFVCLYFRSFVIFFISPVFSLRLSVFLCYVLVFSYFVYSFANFFYSLFPFFKTFTKKRFVTYFSFPNVNSNLEWQRKSTVHNEDSKHTRWRHFPQYPYKVSREEMTKLWELNQNDILRR